ncbi:hypothetical protein FXO37_00694 [Capsicum annuum]|nr:hypothetical protein FXO37_00694 [Capsicum annuum]
MFEVTAIKGFYAKPAGDMSLSAPTINGAISFKILNKIRFLHPTFGVITVIPRSLDYTISDKKGPLDTIWSLKPETQVEYKTVTELFNSKYEDCVEDIHMVTSTSPDHMLYARIVVRDVSTINRILSICPIVKFNVNGKQFWTRKPKHKDQYRS